MSLREFFFENFAGDLEYHPRRAALYLVLAVAAAGRVRHPTFLRDSAL